MKLDFEDELNDLREENDQLNTDIEELQEILKTKDTMLDDKNEEIKELKETIEQKEQEMINRIQEYDKDVDVKSQKEYFEQKLEAEYKENSVSFF